MGREERGEDCEDFIKAMERGFRGLGGYTRISTINRRER